MGGVISNASFYFSFQRLVFPPEAMLHFGIKLKDMMTNAMLFTSYDQSVYAIHKTAQTPWATPNTNSQTLVNDATRFYYLVGQGVAPMMITSAALIVVFAGLLSGQPGKTATSTALGVVVFSSIMRYVTTNSNFRRSLTNFNMFFMVTTFSVVCAVLYHQLVPEDIA